MREMRVGIMHCEIDITHYEEIEKNEGEMRLDGVAVEENAADGISR